MLAGAELQAVCLSVNLTCFSILGAVALDFAFNRKNGTAYLPEDQ